MLEASQVATEPVLLPSHKEIQNVNNIHIPKPQTKDQLEQLIYRYRAIQQHPVENKLEINLLEEVFIDISNDQDEYNKIVEQLRSDLLSTTDEPKENYDTDLLKKQILALQLLERDLDIPDGLLSSDETTNTNKTSAQFGNGSVSPIKLTLDFYKNAEAFGLADKLSKKPTAQLGHVDTETAITKDIAKRIKELENLPANIGSYSLDDSLEFLTTDALPSNVDILKIKALIELKSLKALTKQKSLRQKLITNVTTSAHQTIPSLRDSPYTMAATRSVYVRPKVIVPQTVRLAEELERQQLLEKRKKQRNLHLKKIYNIIDFVKETQENKNPRRDRCSVFGKFCTTAHNQIEKDEQRRIERTAKQRLAALKSNDEEAYLKLLDQTKDTRITQLLKQTNSFLDSLAQAVQVQQNEAKLLNGEEIKPLTDEDREKIDYYEVAHRIKEKISKQPSILVGGTLKEYQLRGLEWMVSLYNNHLNGILADEMGLGKTIQSISLITYLFESKKEPGPFLVIVPLSTITNWTLEFEKWAPSLNTIIYKGTPNQRRSLQHEIRNGNFDVLLTTYEYIIKDKALLSKHDWAHMIIDEGHRMKNAQSKLSYTISHYYRTRNRLILTGTPLQNNLPELWALLNFVLPKIFNSAKTFEDWFNTPFANTGTQEKLELTEEETLLVIRRLHKVLRPFLLRRLKKEVEKDLPDKVEKVIKCKLSGLQQQLYEQMLKHNALFVGAGTEGATKTGIKGLNNKIMQLRKICNHPFVFDEVEGVVNPSRGNSDVLYRVAGKFELLDRVLPKFKASGHRVLMFFQMTQVMDIMEDFLRMKDLKYMRLDGSTKADDRTGMLKEFNAPNSEYFCFLLSTRAGGLGLNLQTADTVIIFDTDWNPHQDLQAQDRAHRIGQKNEVRILRLITTDSVEEVILERAMQKLDIDGKVIQAGKFDNKSTAEEQEEFLRKLLENEMRDDEDNDAELDDDELNEILARSPEEKIMFDKMDKERITNEKKIAKANGLKTVPPRLIQVSELPAIFRENIEEHFKDEPVAIGRIREKKRVYYDDGLTEEQFLEAVEDENNTLEDAIQKRREARDRRRQKKEAQKVGIETLENSPDTTVETEPTAAEVTLPDGVGENIANEENIPIKEPTPVQTPRRRTRKRKASQEPEPEPEPQPQPTVNEVTEENHVTAPPVIDGKVDQEPEIAEPVKKRPKLKIKLTLKKKSPDVPLPTDDVKEPEETKQDVEDAKPKPKGRGRGRGKAKKTAPSDFTSTVEKLFEEMRSITDNADGHAVTEVFEKLPSRKLYPDYYTLIQKPIALDKIIKDCKKGSYNSIEEVKEDLQTMYQNARFYNEEGSWVYNDADTLDKFTSEWFQKHSEQEK
ncbi:RSC chromatin remodeling complex ATPase subunit STH1 NDAI_0B03840 [Naumovozyma dairenensis CBS 421]|uniref:Uncharacterized protein n=1 Tax=Naumovozyma dairenensis (strain ATCC 10597 / BCRC 20456 / CBS 421 / NBRC 0211 / NRRL Y-12639) TaxID=1071378 RepID=G0W6K7_NAUDC|nr:hypothetical protein NDAI_0B03840 [Naumovozyma dairenensis CBS 421]CCD23418.1 hypothetical protein NDAI_0B03840 [Naumovozyma dairenensis CBS 421]